MQKPIVIIESPFAGDTARNVRYLRAALRDALHRGEAPFTSHGLYTLPGVLDDDDPSERELGISAGFAFYRAADRCVAYTDLGLSAGMRQGITVAINHGIAVSYRKIGGMWAPYAAGGLR